MQDLVIVNANEVIIQNQGKVYFDTFQNFLSDYSKEFGYTSIDYNKATQHAYIDGQPFQEFPNQFCENLLEEIDVLLERQDKRIHPYVEKTLDQLKSEKLLELASICHNFDDRLVNNDMFIISSLGLKINADLRSQNNIRGLIAVNADTVNFVDYNNEAHELTTSDLNTLLIECSKNGENLYKQKWAYADKIKSCDTVEELDLIDFKFTMMDFSNE